MRCSDYGTENKCTWCTQQHMDNMLWHLMQCSIFSKYFSPFPMEFNFYINKALLTWHNNIYKANVAHFFMRPFLMFCQISFSFLCCCSQLVQYFILFLSLLLLLLYYGYIGFSPFYQSLVFLHLKLVCTMYMWPNRTKNSMDYIFIRSCLYFSISISISHPLLIIIFI